MTPDEKEARMRKMRGKVERNNVFRWAGHILEEMKKQR
jgi:trehalose-6-phosphate synthase